MAEFVQGFTAVESILIYDEWKLLASMNLNHKQSVTDSWKASYMYITFITDGNNRKTLTELPPF